MGNNHLVDKDAFSSGQISSKLWLCRELEKLNWVSQETWIYGGWHGLMGFLLLSREKFPVDKIRSIDIDPTCADIADMINENWVWQNWKFKAQTDDCNTVYPAGVDLIINTSTEHFDSLDWWNNIPIGTRVALQTNNMKHSDHIRCCQTINEMKSVYSLTTVNYEGSLDFVYPNWSFTRFMLIGVK